VRPAQETKHDWAPFESKSVYDWAHLEFVRKRSSREDINNALRIWAESYRERTGESWAPFADVDDMYAKIDDITLGRCTWYHFKVKYTGSDRDLPQAPSWKQASYNVYARDTLEALKSQLSSPDFDGHYDYSAKQDFVKESDGIWDRKYSNLMTGDWAWKKSVSEVLLLVLHSV
jgi:hypothetical protein